MFFRFGPHTHPANEVNLTNFEVIPRFSDRGRPMTVMKRLHIYGELIYSGQSSLHTKISQLIDAYSLQNMDQDCGLFHDDGTPTRHKLESSTTNPNNLTGVRLAYRSWPKAEPEEYTTVRTFYIRLEAEYKDLESQLIAYSEVVNGIGTTGPRFLWSELASGVAKRQLINERTVQHVVQEGSVVGFDGYPAQFIYGSGPLFPLLEDVDQRYIRRHAPRYVGRAFTHYQIDWRYVFRSATDTDAYPRIF